MLDPPQALSTRHQSTLHVQSMLLQLLALRPTQLIQRGRHAWGSDVFVFHRENLLLLDSDPDCFSVVTGRPYRFLYAQHLIFIGFSLITEQTFGMGL